MMPSMVLNTRAKDCFEVVSQDQFRSVLPAWQPTIELRDLYRQVVTQDEHSEGQGERIHPTLPIYANREARLFAYWDHKPR